MAEYYTDKLEPAYPGCWMFAEQVADLFRINDWLGLGGASHEKAVARVYKTTVDNYTHLLELGRPEPGVNQFVSSGRVIVHRYSWDGEPDEIHICVTGTTLINNHLNGKFEAI